MLDRERGVWVVLFFFSLLLCYGSIALGIGETSDPGPGFFPFFAGLIIAGLSVAGIISSRKRSPDQKRNGPLLTTSAALILGILIAFGFLVERVGFFVCSFFAVLLMLRANGVTKWSYLLLVSVLTCVGIFLGFNVVLEMRLPLGVLGILSGR